MKKIFYIRVIAVLAIVVLFAVSGCSTKKETVRESSPSPAEMKQEPAIQPQEEMKPSWEAETKEPKIVAEGEQKVAAAQAAYDMADIHFDFDDYVLRQEDRKILNNHADWLLKNSEYRVKIEGNCDERGTEEYNLVLGQRRADEAKQYLINMGINEKRLSTISYGKDNPVDPGHDENAWVKNRRDKFVLSK